VAERYFQEEQKKRNYGVWDAYGKLRLEQSAQEKCLEIRCERQAETVPQRTL
jgi:hypothetical protein